MRVKNGLPLVESREDLSKLAESHSKYMAENGITHMDANGLSARQRITNAGYGAGSPGELIYGGQANSEDARDFWENDPAHLAVILNPDNSVIGIGIYKSGDLTYFTVDFGKPAQE